MSSFSIVVVNAFSLSGRSRVITAIPSSILIDMCSTGTSFSGWRSANDNRYSAHIGSSRRFLSIRCVPRLFGSKLGKTQAPRK